MEATSEALHERTIIYTPFNYHDGTPGVLAGKFTPTGPSVSAPGRTKEEATENLVTFLVKCADAELWRMKNAGEAAK